VLKNGASGRDPSLRGSCKCSHIFEKARIFDSMPEKPTEIVVPKEKATFRLDRRGRWCNAFGVFRNRRISDYFHSAIRWDEGGYFVCQESDDRIEKVYFPYEDTALFVVDIIMADEIRLLLNTHRRLLLDPADLFVSEDSLYLTRDGERIKFSEQALVKLAEVMDFTDQGYFINVFGRRHRIRESRDGEES
jgi:hypothetical protein